MPDMITERSLNASNASTLAALAALPGPPQTCRTYCEETDAPYEFVPGDATAADGVVVITPTGGTPGRWLVRSDRISIASTGGDQAARLQTIWNACAGKVEVHHRAGTFTISGNNVTAPSYLVAKGAGKDKTVFSSGLTADANPNNAPIVALQLGPVITTTVSAVNLLGSLIVQVTDDAGGNIVVGSDVFIRDNVTGSAFQANTYVVVTKTAAGGGKFNLRLDRPVMYQFGIGDVVTFRPVGSVPEHIYFSDLSIVAADNAHGGTRLTQFAGTRHCVFERVKWVASTGVSDIVCSWDVGGYNNLRIDCECYGNGGGTDGFDKESQDGTHDIRSIVRDMPQKGIQNFDCVGCIDEDCDVTGCDFGNSVTADGNTIGCKDHKLLGGRYNTNTSGNISVVSGSSGTRIDDVDARFGAIGLSTGTDVDVTISGMTSFLGSTTSLSQGVGSVVVDDEDMLAALLQLSPFVMLQADNRFVVQALTKCAQWNDRGPAGYNIAQAVPGNQPAYTPRNGLYGNRPTLDFTAGAATRLTTLVSLGLNQPFWWLIVANNTANITDIVSGVGSYLGTSSTGGPEKLALYAGATIGGGLGTVARMDNPAVAIGEFNGANSKGFVGQYGTPQVTGNPGAGGFTNMTVGGTGILANPMTGSVALVVGFSGTTTLAKRRLAMSLAAKYYKLPLTQS